MRLKLDFCRESGATAVTSTSSFHRWPSPSALNIFLSENLLRLFDIAFIPVDSARNRDWPIRLNVASLYTSS